MDINALQMDLNEDELNALLAAHVPASLSVEQLRVRLTPEGVFLLGAYDTVFAKVPFETHWQLRAVAGQLEAQLVGLKVSGVPGNLFRKTVLDMAQDMLGAHPGIVLDDETLRVDLEAAARFYDVPLRCKLKALHCESGKLKLEAGLP